MSRTAVLLLDIAQNGLPDQATLKLLADRAGNEAEGFFQTDYATLRGALIALVEGALNNTSADGKSRTLVLTVLANLSKETSYAPVIMEAVQTMSEGWVCLRAAA
jgi:hypothetical protein